MDAVIHLAAYQDYQLDFSHFFEVNVVGTALMYEVAVEQKLELSKVVVASSQAVYGEAAYNCWNESCSGASVGNLRHPPPRPKEQLERAEWDVMCPHCGGPLEVTATTEAVVSPHNQYALSKHAQEALALTLGRRWGIPTVAMRYSIVQGSRQSFRNAYSGVLRIFTQRVLNGAAPVCYEDGRQLRDYVSVHDVVRANLLALTDPRADYHAFNVGGDRRVSVLDYAQLVVRTAGVAVEPQVPGLYRFGDTRHVVSEIGRLRQLGWSPQVPLESIVAEYIEWVRTCPGFGDYSREAEERMKEMGTLRETVAV
jgi:dTDP-L-rhamnose 4-epimerase